MGFAEYQPECCAPTPKPRTPADIGRDIAAAEQRIRDLKAELSDVPASELVLESVNRRPTGLHLRPLPDKSGPFVGCVYVYESLTNTDTFGIVKAAPLRDWLNYYFPKEA